MRIASVVTASLVLGASGLAAQERINETRRASGDGTVIIENLAGSVRVSGWDRSEVQVTGTLGRPAERVDFSSSGSTLRIEVVIPRGRHQNIEPTDLEVRIPSGSRLEVETVSADIDVTGVKGAMDIESVSGDIGLRGVIRDIRVAAVSGDVQIDGPVEDLRASTVSGDLRARDVRGRVEAETVSGTVDVSGPRISDGTFKAVSGGVRFEGGLSPQGSYSFESFSGTVELMLPRDVEATFDVSTFSGSISSDFEMEVRRQRYGPEKEAQFTLNGGGARVSAKAFSGAVRIRSR